MEKRLICLVISDKPNFEVLVFIAELFVKAFFLPPTKCHSRLQLRLIHFYDCCLPNQKSPHTYCDLAHSSESEFLAAGSLFFGSHINFDSDEPITFSWRSPARGDFASSSCLWYPRIVLSWLEVFFSRHNDKLLPTQSSFGVRRSRRIWVPGPL